ncbi:MAG TPA: hypothetical protein DCS05_07990 [Nitrospiraceae bacterium]|nr:hypothetical protein [Nitrospiraceae bacterium]
MSDKIGLTWIQRLVLGQFFKGVEKQAMNLSKNTTTTLLGTFMILAAVGNAGVAVLDGNPATVFNWQVTLGFLAAGWTAIKAREQGQHDKENGK